MLALNKDVEDFKILLSSRIADRAGLDDDRSEVFWRG